MAAASPGAEGATTLGAVPNWYTQLLKEKRLTQDPRQQEAAQLLDTFARQPADTAHAKNGIWSRLTNRSPDRNNLNPSIRGIYLHGSVGRGKTFLMDEFFLHLSLPKKRRVHFHAFMRHFHQSMGASSSKDKDKKPDAMEELIADIAREFDLICFDEFHVSDIGDAMILARILEGLLAKGTRLIMTSNYAPKDLYPDGLARHLFLPTIALIEKSFTVFDLGAGTDYRREKLSGNERYFYPLTASSRQKLSAVYTGLACGSDLPPYLETGGRKIPAVARCSDSIWFDFSKLCDAACGKGDYLRVAEKFNVVFISDIPLLNDPALGEAARRFTWLIDILYDERCVLVMSAAAPLRELYGTGNSTGNNTDSGGESGRTLSRLFEMHSADYLNSRLSKSKKK